MENFQEVVKYLKIVGFELVLFLAGLFGAFVSVSKDKHLKLADRITSILSGGLIANYLTPIFVNFMNANDSISYGLAFVLGYMGLKSVELLIENIRNRISKKEK